MAHAPQSLRICLSLGALTQGGIRTAFLALAQALTDLGHRVDLLVIGPVPREVQIPKSVSVIGLGARTRGALFRAVGYLKTAQPDLIITARVYIDLLMLLARKLARCRQARLVWTFHTHQSLEAASKPRAWQVLYRAAFAVSGHVDHLIAVSGGVADDIEARFLPARYGTARRRVEIIHNPIALPMNTDRTAPHPWLEPDSKRPFTLVACGRLVPQKDYVTLLNAISCQTSGRPVRLIVLGEGPLRGELLQRVEALSLQDRVIFPGHVENPMDFMRFADLFVSSALWEGFGIAIAEALASRCPVIATDCPSGPSEILERGRYGRLVPPGNAGALADAITEAANGNGRVLTEEEAQQALQRFLPSTVAQSYLALLNDSVPHPGISG
ncbi:glycosyltransferase [Celeribacter persicus]|uniref:Glycosyltransferase involved in cell wall biosynthesis n=1 Tax=Celeribacter persicus TaxID=1651082 RepID=A0A2T5HTT4_9RHOB|nr:glycosyltransferase [Celeribacter persicus]PTQ74993.1 glycosyltransferase involved in cell wall biosynthesis [Celeribacter persicus]